MRTPAGARTLSGLALALTLVGARPSGGLDVNLVSTGPLPVCSGSAIELVAESSAAQVSAVRVPVRGNHGHLQLSPGEWDIHLAAPSCWSEPMHLKVRDDNETVTLPVYVGTQVKGRLSPDKEVTVPNRVRLVFQPSVPSKDTPPGSSCSCVVARDLSWTCTLPSGRMNLHLDLGPHVPRYVWGASLPPGGKVDLGAFAVRSGPSISGWLNHDLPADAADACLVELWPAVGVPFRRGRGTSVKPDAHGFFQLEGMAPGPYRVAATCTPLFSAQREVEITADDEHLFLEEPLKIVTLTLDLNVTPPLDSAGEEWRPKLRPPDGSGSVAKTARLSPGSWRVTGLSTGAYLVSISSSDGNVWFDRMLRFDEGQGALDLTLPTEGRLRGTILLANRPLRARISLRAAAGVAVFQYESDDDGRFEGSFAQPLREAERVWTARVEAERPSFPRVIQEADITTGADGSAELNLSLTDLGTGRISGIVTKADDTPFPRAGVRLASAGGSSRTAISDDSGAFAFLDVEYGEHVLTASGVLKAEGGAGSTLVQSQEEKVTLGPEPPPFARLVMRPKTLVEYELRDEQDQPVSGAMIQVRGSSQVPYRFLWSDPAGRFSLAQTSDAEPLSLAVAAPGYALRMLRLPPADAPPTIRLSRVAGSLLLKGVPNDLSSAALWRGGAMETLAFIEKAAALSGVAARGGGGFTVPALEPGEYSACIARDAAAVTKPTTCVRAVVEPGGGAVVDLPAISR